MKCAQFYADRVSKPMADHQIYAGDVFELVDQATRFVMTHVSNWVGTRETGETAEVPTKFELPYDAVKEAVVNAVVHRDYASLASVQVMLFRDRLEVWSPGALPRGMTVPKLFKAHQSLPVNPLLARAMYLKGYIEETDTEDMIAKCAEWGVAAPEWIEEDDVFRVILKRPAGTASNGNATDSGGSKSRVWSRVESRDRSRDKSRDKILALIGRFPEIRQSEMAKASGLSVKGVEKIVSRLKAEGSIVRVGGKRFGRWKLGDKKPRT